MGTSSVQSVERTFHIIEALSSYPKGASLSELSEKIGLHKSTVYRLLSTLIAMKYVAKDEENGKYKLTTHLFEVGSRAFDGLDILSVSRPYLEKLTALTNEVTHLVIPDDCRVFYLYKEIPHNLSMMSSRIGGYNYMYCTGVGKSILAVLSDEDIIEIWHKSEIIPYTENTITSLADMQREIRQIRKQGYAVDNGEHEPSIRCVAAAIRDYSGKAIAAISVAAAKERMSDSRIAEVAPLITSTAKNISKVFGGHIEI